MDCLLCCVAQVQRFLEKNQREAHVTLFDQGEMGGGSKQEPEDRPPFLGEVTGEEKSWRSKERKGAEEGNTEAGGEQILDTEWTKCTQPSTSFNSATCTEDVEVDDEEQPGRQLTCFGIPDFLLSDAPENNNGKQ